MDSDTYTHTPLLVPEQQAAIFEYERCVDCEVEKARAMLLVGTPIPLYYGDECHARDLFIEEALRALRADAAGSPAAMTPCHRAAAKALAEPDADLTCAERESLAERAAEAAPVDTGPRDQILRVRMSGFEMDELARPADGRPLSVHVRSRVFSG